MLFIKFFIFFNFILSFIYNFLLYLSFIHIFFILLKPINNTKYIKDYLII